MAVLSFRFDGRDSAVRRWDIRFRVAAAAGFSAFVAAAPPGALPFLAAQVALGLALAGCRWTEAFRVVGGFLPFLAFFFGLGLLFEPTAAQAAFLGWQGVRLMLLLLGGHLLLLAATPADVTEGLRWYLGWLGPRRAWAAASMAGWALASVPLVLDQASGLLDAAALRGLTLRRHPLRVLKLLTLGLLIRTVERSADLAASLEARGFGTGVPDLRLWARPQDAAALVVCLAWGGLAAWVGGTLGA